MGTGTRPRRDTLDGYTIEQLSADLAALLEAEGGGPVDLLGHSMGGRVVMGLVLARPDLRALADPDGHRARGPSSRPTRRSATLRPRVHAWRSTRAEGMPATLQHGRAGGRAHRGGHAGRSGSQEKDAIFAGMDPYAVKALGAALDGRRRPTTATSLRGQPPGASRVRRRSSSVSTTTRWSTRPPRWPARWPTAGSRVIAGAYHSPQLTHATEWRAAVESHLAWAARTVGTE